MIKFLNLFHIFRVRVFADDTRSLQYPTKWSRTRTLHFGEELPSHINSLWRVRITLLLNMHLVLRWIKRLMMPFKPGYLQYAIDLIFWPAGEFDGRRRLHETVQEFSTGLKFVQCSVNIASLFNFMHQNNRTVLEIVTLTKYLNILCYLFICLYIFV